MNRCILQGEKSQYPLVVTNTDFGGKSLYQKLTLWEGVLHSSLPGHSGGSPGLVQIWSSHLHQDWEAHTGDHSEFRGICHKFPSGRQQPPIAASGLIARAAWRIFHNSDWRQMCVSSGETSVMWEILASLDERGALIFPS